MSARVEIDVAGVRELLNSDGVVSLLQSECDAAAARCNGLVSWHSPMDAPAYRGVVDHAPYSAVGKVVMNGLGRDGLAVAHEDAKHNTLLKGCGW